MDYYKIGQRIRKYRKAQSYSQEQLAEMVGISVTHMSHIETGNTKLSLPVLVNLAEVLGVQTDDILKEQHSSKDATISEIIGIIENCDEKELCMIKDIIKSTRDAINKYYE